MICTEAEAKTKWCPQARSMAHDNSGGDPVALNRDPFGKADDACRCIASACMLWEQVTETKGYCGLRR